MHWPPRFDALPVLETPRLRLRAFRDTDADSVFNLVSDLAVAKWTARIPHPYERAMTRDWLGETDRRMRHGAGVTFALEDKMAGMMVGSAGLDFGDRPGEAEIGYYLGRAYWGNGYMSEAAGAVLQFGFGQLDLDSVKAEVMTDNAASLKVLGRWGFAIEGREQVEAPARGGKVAMDVLRLTRDMWRERME